jgi:DNA repair protein RecO (recombination protein O)
VSRLVGEALLLRAVDYGESDRIVHLLMPEVGRVSVIAKGARRSVKRFPGTLDIFNLLRVTINRRRPTSMGLLEQAVLLHPFLELRVLPGRYALASYLIELLGRMAPEGGAGPDTRRLFHFAKTTLEALEGMEPDLRLRILLELRALDALGLRPELSHCVRCGAAPGERAGFLIADGGVVCAQCAAPLEGVLPVHLGTLRVLQQGLDFDLDRLGRLALGPRALAEAEQLVFRFHRYHVGLELRSERFLDDTLHASPRDPA